VDAGAAPTVLFVTRPFCKVCVVLMHARYAGAAHTTLFITTELLCVIGSEMHILSLRMVTSHSCMSILPFGMHVPYESWRLQVCQYMRPKVTQLAEQFRNVRFLNLSAGPENFKVGAGGRRRRERAGSVPRGDLHMTVCCYWSPRLSLHRALVEHTPFLLLRMKGEGDVSLLLRFRWCDQVAEFLRVPGYPHFILYNKGQRIFEHNALDPELVQQIFTLAKQSPQSSS
jgi:hypothetical protein